MSGRVCFCYHYKRFFYRFRFGSRCWSGWLLPVVLSHRHTAQTLFSAVVTCKVYPVHAERRTADPICHCCTATAVVYCCAGRTLNPIGLLCLFSRAAASLWLRGCFAGHLVIRLWLVPFDIAKLQPLFVINQIKNLFSFVFIHLYIFVKVYLLNL